MTTKTAAVLLKLFKEMNEYPHTTPSSDEYPTFAVRVQLSNAELYDDLHKVMEKHDFHRTIIDGNGKLKDLPTAMYSYVAKSEYLSCETVFGYAKDAVNEHLDITNQRDAGVELFVSDLTGAWFDLKDAQK